MNGGLRELLELPDVKSSTGVSGSGDFRQKFRTELSAVNQDLQVLAAHGGAGLHQKMDANRQSLIAAYQTASGLGDPTKNDQVMNAVAKVRQKTTSQAAVITADQTKWLERQESFNTAVEQIGHLEEGGDPTAPAFRKVSDAIQARVDSHDYRQALTAFDQLQSRLDQAMPQPPQAGTCNGNGFVGNGSPSNVPGGGGGHAPVAPGGPTADSGKPVHVALNEFERKPLKRKAPNPGWGGSTTDDSSIEFDVRAHLFVNGARVRDQTPLNPSGSLNIDAGQTGRLKIFTTIEGFQDNLPIPIVGGNDSFTQEAEGTWDISADEKGSLKITRVAFNLEGPSSTDTDYSVQPITTSEDEAKGVISFNIVVAGKNASKSSTWNVGVSGKKGVEGGYERNTTYQSGPGIVQEMFSVKINVVNIPKPKDPTGTVEVGNEVTVFVDGEFVIGPFVVDSPRDLDKKSPFNSGSATHLKESSVEKAVYALFYSLPEGTRDSLKNGKLAGSELGDGRKIEVDGYASNTGKEKWNYELSKQRAQTVFDAFKGLGVPAEVFQPPHPHGEWDKGMESTDVKEREKESANWRKVVIKLRYGQVIKVK